MACLRHRMRSRRGGTRGGFIRMLALTSSTTDSPNSSTDTLNPLCRYPNIRSCRGRARNQAIEGRNIAVHTTDFPLPPYPAPHSTQFRFRSILNRPIITPIVTISFAEESEPQAPPTRLKGKQSMEASGSQGINIPSNRPRNEGRATLHGKDIAGSPSTESGKHSGTKASGSKSNNTSETQMGIGGTEEAPPNQGRGVSDVDDDWYQFACRIEEEPAPEDPPN